MSEDVAAIEAARKLFAGPCTFMQGASSLESLPPPGAVEIAFAGRSNVGKSSLLNALTGRSGLARVSNTPGRTQEINFFDLGGVLTLVDLPGYGFAKAPREQVATWTRLIETFLAGRQPLKRVCLLIDSRHGPKSVDLDAMKLLDGAAMSYQAVLTKADKVRPTALKAVQEALATELRKHPAAHPEIITTSSEKGIGLAELRAAIASLA
ncbi:ribosome biogenesis GTP-binding protein YihA/YsxC [Zavarzinia sp. CC-PAN008]|uniref:ribosome biogenesis GTP-binding protein YihA/YsxC n=1 Tax=Zavarzinia sp. CC-PAN008 TaxID=3243332 RepID=UPI003F746EE3